MSCAQIIHSGHFMVSEPHADPEPDPGPGPGQEALTAAEGQAAPRRPRREACAAGAAEGAGPAREGDGGAQRGPGAPAAAYDFDTVNGGTCLIYRYGPRSSGALNIDASLTRLFECMTLAYSGKIVSPKWKTFKGLKLLQRDKIRLNNAIWRAWYLQYVEKRQNPVCSFVTPLECCDVDEHRKPEAVIMEGKYWKRQIGVVIREYHKWRTFFHTQAQKKKDKPVCGPVQEVAATSPGGELKGETTAASPMDLDPLHDLEEVLDTIFSGRNPYGGPNLRGLVHQDNADMIQPTLVQLHPFFGEEFMDTLDPIQEFISSCRSQPIVQAPALLGDATGLGQCDPGAPRIDVQTKDTSQPEDDLPSMPVSLDGEQPTPLNGQQTYLPFFPTSPPRTSPPTAPSILQMQPQTTLVLSVVTHTGAENISSLSTPRDTFVAPASAPPAKSGRCRQLQRIAPAPSFSHHPGLPSECLPQLLTAGPDPLPLTPVRSSAKMRDTSKPSSDVIPNSVSATQKTLLPLSAAAATFNTSAKIKERGEEKPTCTSQEMYKGYIAKGNRRSTPTSADHARRMVISSGFNALASLVLPRSDQTSAKLSKAVLLQKSAVYVGRLQQERQQAQETVERLRSEVEELSTAIDNFQRQLPPSGAPVPPLQSDCVSQLYEEYVRQRTLQDWRFWLFSVLIKPLFESYIRTVNTGSIKEFCQSVLDWLDQHCSLPILRPAISGSLLQLSKITSILTQPARLPAQAVQAVSCSPQCKGNS